eukprot:INCI12792.3.p1 GENE.INCI12792.3~~INCI12792.3.p1  ORF type:complete len:552 (+),score=83.29 INCI12792.3:237-1658(+)
MWREDEGKSLRVQAFYPPKNSRRTRSDLTMAEVAKHDKRDDAWIVVDGHCYDVTAYVDTHPGGWLPIANLAGKDVTDAFANYHPARVYEQLLPRYYIGEVADYEVSDFVKEHRALRQQLLERNMFETSRWYYVRKIAILVVLFTTAIYLTVVAEQRFLGACLLGVFWQQLAFIGHDVGHNAISHLREADLFWGAAFGNLTGGISLAWWKRSHNVHHIVCNSVENDPDIQHIPIFAVTQKMFKRFFSTYHRKFFEMDNFVARFLVGHQHLTFYPVMAFARFNLYLQSWLLLLSSEAVPQRKLEMVSLFGFAVWLTALCASMPSWPVALMFLFVSHSIAGILHVQICLSHFYMDTYHGRAYNDDSDEWFTMQLKTTMNVSCPRWMDWFHGGLQFQIEHHLWPRLPRHNLREAQKLVIPFCKKHGIRYYAPGFIRGNIELVRELKRVADDCRDDDKFTAASKFYDSAIWNGLNARG